MGPSSDQALDERRRQLYVVAEAALDFRKAGPTGAVGDGNQWNEAERLLPDSCKLEAEERAAVFEFDAKQ